MKRNLTAKTLQMILSATLIIVVLLTSAGLYFAYTQLQTFAVDVSHVSADAQASQTTVQTLEKIQKELEENREVVERTGNIVAESQSYQYQDQIIADLNGYASKAGISISGIDFSTDEAGSSAPAGLKSTSVSIAIKNPVVYENLLRFIKSIEQNLTKMQISSIGLSRDTDNNVISEDLVIEVYIK